MVCYVQHVPTSLKPPDFILNAAAPDDGEESLTEPGGCFSGALHISQSGDETVGSGSGKARREQAVAQAGKCTAKGIGVEGELGTLIAVNVP